MHTVQISERSELLDFPRLVCKGNCLGRYQIIGVVSLAFIFIGLVNKT